MRQLLQGEGWVELLFALIAMSLFVIWLGVVLSSRLNSMSVWEAWGSQHQPAPAERVAASIPSAPSVHTGEALAAR